eukprot:CAMPEP_0181176976 /NCGR_PEP_ID=MMETSP1096-20121128/4916_1 /TAXON_ID=156174 ORGANISM="Chrysochromulina ericina, Strain CCMP281" /NCGR_SAMPLE_ID=MMETSP1096 /ASSEMBLY_ACC=CAM_ASM_000453 /LENGTH=126 /DNA_ID=CAMNT_0023265099 /DNA_START=403 /DNA_END=783 /DNA_ORIENTATION=-
MPRLLKHLVSWRDLDETPLMPTTAQYSWAQRHGTAWHAWHRMRNEGSTHECGIMRHDRERSKVNRHEQNAHPVANLQGLQHSEHGRLSVDVEATQHLVTDQQPWLCGEHRQYVDEMPLATGEFAYF